MWVLISITIRGRLLGIVGMLLSVFISSVIKEDVKKRLERKNLKI